MPTITLELPDTTPLAALRTLADSMDCDLRFCGSGFYRVIARPTRAQVVPLRRKSAPIQGGETLETKAARWRESNGRSGGFVIFRNGVVIGWEQVLGELTPGCIAVDEHGFEWAAMGGRYAAAKRGTRS